MSDTSGPSTDATPGAFHEFEHAGWERAADEYASAFGELTQQAGGPLLDAAGARAGVDLLDVATGPGFVAGLAAARGAAVTGMDFSAAMLAQARRRHPDIAFVEGDAAQLPFDGGRFGAVVMNFGMLHLERPDRAIAEALRVLKPGGRYAFTVWADPSVAIGFGAVMRAIARHGTTDVGLPEGPPFFRFSSESESRAALERVGFTAVESRMIPLVWRVTDPDGVFEALSRGGVRTGAVLRAQTPEILARIREQVRREVQTYARADRFEVPTPAVVTSAVKP